MDRVLPVSTSRRVGGGGSAIAFSVRRTRSRNQRCWAVQEAWFDAGWRIRFGVGFVNDETPLIPLADGEVDMWSEPELRLGNFRVVGTVEGDPLPPYFRGLGRRFNDQDQARVDQESGAVSINAGMQAGDIEPKASLLAVDFYVSVARATYQGAANIVDGSGTSGSIVDYAVTFNTENLDRFGARARFRQAPKIAPVIEPTLLDRLSGGYQDDGEDRRLIATLFLMSPDGVDAVVPDETWQPLVQYHEFWNLGYAARNDPPATGYRPIQLVTGLAFGLGDSIANQYLSLINDQAAQILNAVNTTDNRGEFWSV